MDKYDDIIRLPRHISQTHKHMSNRDRAAQFAPFAALSGQEEAIIETARQTSQKLILDESQKEILNRKLQYLNHLIQQKPSVSITYFMRDLLKDGGEYITIQGRIRKIDDYEQVILIDRLKIKIEDIINIDGKILENIQF